MFVNEGFWVFLEEGISQFQLMLGDQPSAEDKICQEVFSCKQMLAGSAAEGIDQGIFRFVALEDASLVVDAVDPSS